MIKFGLSAPAAALAAPFLWAVLAATPALADCAQDASAARGRLDQVKEPARREEVRELLEKAERDFRAGRAWLCADAVKRANQILK
jgi:hypothetical protein